MRTLKTRHFRPAILLVLGVIVATALTIALILVERRWAGMNPWYRQASTHELSWPDHPTFQSSWQDLSKRVSTSMIWYDPSNKPYICGAQGTFLPINDDAQMVLLIKMPDNDAQPAGAPAMQIAVASLVGVNTKYDGETAIVPDDAGHPRIICNLNPAQMLQVQVNGLPQSLIDAIHTKALESGWRPRGVANDHGEQTAPILIDPQPHFR